MGPEQANDLILLIHSIWLKPGEMLETCASHGKRYRRFALYIKVKSPPVRPAWSRSKEGIRAAKHANGARIYPTSQHFISRAVPYAQTPPFHRPDRVSSPGFVRGGRVELAAELDLPGRIIIRLQGDRLYPSARRRMIAWASNSCQQTSVGRPMARSRARFTSDSARALSAGRPNRGAASA